MNVLGKIKSKKQKDFNSNNPNEKLEKKEESKKIPEPTNIYATQFVKK